VNSFVEKAKMSEVNNHPNGEKIPNLVTLIPLDLNNKKEFPALAACHCVCLHT
jgi:hypothetical protein